MSIILLAGLFFGVISIINYLILKQYNYNQRKATTALEQKLSDNDLIILSINTQNSFQKMGVVLGWVEDQTDAAELDSKGMLL